MSMFVTQSLESSVTVLVFARPSPVVEALKAALQEKHLEVLVVDPLKFTDKQASEFNHKSFYKICWLFDDTLKGTVLADLVFQFLFGREEPIIILTATLGREDPSSSWKEKKKGDEALVDHLRKNLSAARVMVAVNWFDLPDLFVSPLHFFIDAQTASSELKSGVEASTVVDELSRVLVRPHRQGADTIEKNKNFTSGELEKYFVGRPLVERREEQVAVQVVEQPTETTFTLVRQQLLEEDTLDLVHQEFNIQVIPVPPPRIANRQRQYEENISRIKQRYQKQQILTPVARKVKSPAPPLPEVPKNELQPVERHLEATIQQLFGSQRQEQRVERLQKKVQKTVRAQRKQVRQKRAMKGLSILTALLVVIGVAIGSFVIMRASLFQLILSQASSENLADQEVWQDWKTQALVNALATEIQAYQMIGGVESLPETAAVVSAVRQMQTIHQLRQELKQLGEQSVAQVLGKQPGDVFETVTALAAQQQTLYSSLSVIQTQLQSISTEFLADNEKEAIEKILGEIQQTRRQVATFEQIRQLLPAFLAQNERRRVAIVLQDSQELRPSGGVVGGVYLLTLEKGTIIDQQFFTPTQIEGNKTAALPAPADYKKLLHKDNLQIVDVGWGPDFTETANTLNGLLDHTLGRKADLMVGVTTNTLHDIIEKTGPLALDGTRETLTEKNFYERLESHQEAGYLETVFVTLMERVLREPTQASQALSVVSNELQTGQAFLVSAQSTENDVLNSLGWAGQVSTPQCPSLLGTEGCQISTVYQLESNIGLNKIGSLIERKVEHTIEVGKNQLRHKRLLTLTNQASTNRWPSGPYRDYLRFYLPADAELVMVRVGDTILDLKTLEKGQDKGGQFVGFLVEVPIKSSLNISLEYRQPFSYIAGTGFAFFDQKQAGTLPDDYTLTVVPQDGLQPSVIAPKAEIVNGKIVFQLPREKHQFVGVKFR
ncbi:DUF4012 domain-containing protein [Patescibacteria group bacterium]|nr:DUF4012 domain-containing protein [Patescibacteria group bacterium]